MFFQVVLESLIEKGLPLLRAVSCKASQREGKKATVEVAKSYLTRKKWEFGFG